ncbi:gamma carbonic anhydrase family protein [Helicobacter sp. MIT 14-3879]|uniref:gamma carbonic anhydrase family protein n=1 Tax=Helicobacter sp. MIT 14-3879 TaxID=2040649 RepID=UPI000E1F1DC7|nr:gamma carbonic anhydrase family protein [Helicobacter sp. MIT 14-3879]RDU65187.1 gamma carbonic anhydrase family protein [Helicobacter sp. MIT 14-3879]
MAIIDFEGKLPKIHNSVRIFDNTSIIGDVEIDEDSSIWFGSVLRGDLSSIKIGKRTNIQDLVIIHTYQKDLQFPNGIGVRVGDDTTIGHRVTLHACNIGNRCLVGMGSIVMDNVIVGDDCFITAFSVLPKGKKYSPMSLISGNPAKVVRPLREVEIENIKREAKLYIDLKNRYK